MKIKISAVVVLLVLLCGSVSAQKVIRLHPGAAPGSESWTHQEKEYYSQIFGTEVVTNVAQPTLTVYLPESSSATGTGVVICPGGGFHALSINREGVEVAKWLSARGVAAFVLKYRLVKTGEDGPREMMEKLGNPAKFEADTKGIIPLSIADGLSAIAYVRKNAAEFGVSPQRIGLMGFSAGGTVATAVAFNYTAENRPDFVAPIYPYLGPLNDGAVPKDAPPMFIVTASDDQLGLAPDSINLYNKWLAARKSVELHMYSKGGHGFGMRKQNLPADRWIDRFGDWLGVQGLLK